MNKLRITTILLVILCIGAFALCGCEADEVTAASSNTSNVALAEYSDKCNTILDRASKEFAGNHPIDESFINWIIARYGIDTINQIINRGDYNNPDLWYDICGKSIHVLWYEYSLSTGVDACNNTNTFYVNTLSDSSVVFDIAGDVSLADDKSVTNYMLEQKNGLMDCFDDSLLDQINSSDIYIVNNEFAITEGGDPIVEKYYTFRGKPSVIDELKHVGVSLVTLANNHVYDYREEGFLDTLNNLENNNMPYIGAGRNLEDAKRIVYYIANGRKIAVVNASQIEKNQNFTKAATEDEPGILKCLNPTEFIDEIHAARQNADVVLAIVHWGTEYQIRYGADQEKLATQFADAGADVIIGGHPHILQGFDYIGDTPVYYSLGNFYFALDEGMPADYETGLARIAIGSDGKIEAGFIPCVFSDGMIYMTDKSEDINRLFAELNSVSGNGMLDDNGIIIRK